MANFENIAINSFDLGLVTNLSAVDADKTSFRTFKNVEPLQPGLLSALSGSGTAQIRVAGTLTNVPALPSSFTQEVAFMFHITLPGETDVIVIFGSKSSRDRFYVWPNISSLGAIETTGGSKISNSAINWFELTEAEFFTATNVTDAGTGKNWTIASLSNGASSDYYNHWYLWNNTQGYFDYITDHTNTAIVTKFGNASAADNDVLVLMRFPVFLKAATVSPYYSIDTLPTFAKHGENLVIHTGAHSQNSGPDLWLGYIGNGASSPQGYLDDNDFDFNGWHFDAAQPWLVEAQNSVSSVGVTGSSTDPIPYSGSGTDYFNVVVSGLYDGTEESNLQSFADNAKTPSFGKPGTGSITAADEHFSVILRVLSMTGLSRQSQHASGSNFPTVWSRRIKKLSLYITAAETVDVSTGKWREKSEYFFIKEIDIDDSGWAAGAGSSFLLTTTITGSEYKTAQAYPFSTVNGYVSTRIGANAKFEANAGGRNFIAPIYDSSKKLFRALYSPSERVSPDVFPITNRIDVLHHGIYEIVGIIEQFGRILIFGRERFVAVDVIQNEGQISEALQKVGCVAPLALKNLEGLVFFPSERQMFEIYDGSQIQETPAERLRDIWSATTRARQEAAFAGVHRDRREYWIAFNDADNVQRVFIFSLKFQVFYEYDSSATYIGFMEGTDGNMFALTSSGIVELVSSSPTESLAITVKSQIFNTSRAQYRRLSTAYLSPSTFSIALLDEDQVSDLQTKETKLFLAQASLQDSDNVPISFETERAAWQLSRAASTDTSFKVDSVTLSRRPLKDR